MGLAIRLQTVSQCRRCLLAKQFDQKWKEKSLKCFQVLRKCLGSFFARTTVRVGHSDLASSWCWLCTSLCTEASGEQWLRYLLPGSYRLWFFFHKVLLVTYTRELVKYKPIHSPSLWSGTFFSRCYRIFKGLAVKYLSFVYSLIWGQQVFVSLRSATEHPQNGLHDNVRWISAIVFVVKVQREFCVGQPQHFWETSEGILGVAKSSTPFDLNHSLVFLKLLKG